MEVQAMNEGISGSWADSPMTGAKSRLLFRHKVLGKYDAEYYADATVGYVFAKKPYWLDEAYTSAITSTDTGCVARNVRNVELISQALAQERFDGRGVDLGGGHGLFVRGMRDAGYNFYWTDKYAANLFARGFEAKPGKFECAAAFEVLEHLEDPLNFLRTAKEQFGFNTCFFSATCFREDQIPGMDWWYWSFETGQHISFFSRRALEWIAGELGMTLFHIRHDVYAIAERRWKPLPKTGAEWMWAKLKGSIERGLHPGKSARRQSLTFPDHFDMRDRLAESQKQQ